MYTPPTPTRHNSTVSSRRRRRCVLGLNLSNIFQVRKTATCRPSCRTRKWVIGTPSQLRSLETSALWHYQPHSLCWSVDPKAQSNFDRHVSSCNYHIMGDVIHSQSAATGRWQYTCTVTSRLDYCNAVVALRQWGHRFQLPSYCVFLGFLKCLL